MKDQTKLLVIWDVDGTLVDTAEHHYYAWKITAEKLGRAYGEKEFGETFGIRNPELVKILFGDRFSEEESRCIALEKEELYRQSIASDMELLPGVKELLDGFRRHGFLQAIGSSAPRANLDVILRVTGIGSYFQTSVSGDDVSRGKPDPEPFLLGAKTLGIAPKDCLVIEDAPAGIAGAKAAGMKSLAVCSPHHTKKELEALSPDLVVGDLTQITAEKLLKLFRS
jgi:beta-phosphoglucomutase